MACELCQEYKYINHFWMGDGELLSDNSYGEFDVARLEINYCPICGRKLSDEEDDG